jgi:hypothetical protein
MVPFDLRNTNTNNVRRFIYLNPKWKRAIYDGLTVKGLSRLLGDSAKALARSMVLPLMHASMIAADIVLCCFIGGKGFNRHGRIET